MDLDLMQLYKDSSAWAQEKIAAADDLSTSTPCTDWTLRDLINHMLDTQRYFASAGRGESASPPGANPPDTVGDDPAGAFAAARDEVITVFSADGVIDKTGPTLGIASADALLHGWDVAKATGQDATMPDGLAESAYKVIHGRFTDEQRKGVFGPEIPAPEDATPQQRLLAYTGRNPE